jgi:hypothetical protein
LEVFFSGGKSCFTCSKAVLTTFVWWCEISVKYKNVSLETGVGESWLEKVCSEVEGQCLVHTLEVIENWDLRPKDLSGKHSRGRREGKGGYWYDQASLHWPQTIVERDRIIPTFVHYFFIAPSNRRESRTNCMESLCWIILKPTRWNLNGSNSWLNPCPFDRKSPVLRSFPDIFKHLHWEWEVWVF